jgi:hypothetical protein
VRVGRLDEDRCHLVQTDLGRHADAGEARTERHVLRFGAHRAQRLGDSRDIVQARGALGSGGIPRGDGTAALEDPIAQSLFRGVRKRSGGDEKQIRRQG